MSRSAAQTRELVVHKTVHPVVDALSYFARLANGRPISAAVKGMREQYPERRENINTLFGPLEELELKLNEVSSRLDKARLHFFFDKLGDTAERKRSHCPNIATAIFMPNIGNYEQFQDLDSFRDELKEYSTAEIVFQARMAFSVPNESWLTGECSDFSTFYDYISEFPATDEERYQILGAVRNFGSYVDELTELVRPIVKVIQESTALYQPLLDRFAEVNQDADVGELLRPDVDSTAAVIDLYPCLFSINERFNMYYRIEENAPVHNHMEIGILHDAARQYRKRDVPLKELAAYVKVIGDPVRLQILALLKNQEVYVQDLADKLGLSFTTVSHHMTKLIMAGLVSSERRGIYVYYKANAAFIRWIMDRVGDLTLE
ncbi:MAG: ArsR/SmtB family transcription factor [Faecousia sp.]